MQLKQLLGYSNTSLHICAPGIPSPPPPKCEARCVDILCGFHACRHLINMFSLSLYTVSPPTITSQPQDRLSAIPEAGNVTFAISASGVHLSYSWQHNGQTLSADDGKYEGTDTPILTIHSIQETDEGLYLCVVTNRNGSVTSNTAILMLSRYLLEEKCYMHVTCTNPCTCTLASSYMHVCSLWQQYIRQLSSHPVTPPEILLGPQSMEVERGVIVELSCSAVGGGTLQFTWNTTANVTLPAPSTNEKNSTLTFIMSPTHMGDYQCTVTNERGSSVSETATINISMTTFSSNKGKLGKV